MRRITLNGLVERQFLYRVIHHQQSVQQVVEAIGIPPGHLCQVIAGQNLHGLPLATYHRIARWLNMPLANTLALASRKPKLEELVRLGMEVQRLRSTSAKAQTIAAAQVGISVAVFRRALHGYTDFTPSPTTCDKFAQWLKWTGLDADAIAASSGMLVRYDKQGKRAILSPTLAQTIRPYPCACGRPGCLVPAHIPVGPRRKWRSDACRMWTKRKVKREIAQCASARKKATTPTHHSPIMRFITINERSVPVRF